MYPTVRQICFGLTGETWNVGYKQGMGILKIAMSAFPIDMPIWFISINKSLLFWNAATGIHDSFVTVRSAIFPSIM